MKSASPNTPNGKAAAEEARPFVVPCASLDSGAPLRWLKAGWRDFRAWPRISIAFGFLTFVVSVLVSAMAYTLGSFALLAALLSGFVFFAPLIAVGLYGVSRCSELGRRPSLSRSLRLVRRVIGQAGVFALAQMVILMVWSRTGMMLNALFPVESGETQALIEFLLMGSAIGSIFAAFTFATAVFSLPMIADRDVDMITACVSSINAVLRNKRVAVLWAALIVGLTAIGFATVMIGLIVVMPWLAYAAWHSYRETLDASDWPRLP